MHTDLQRSPIDAPLQKLKCNLQTAGPAVVTGTILNLWPKGKLGPGVPTGGEGVA